MSRRGFTSAFAAIARDQARLVRQMEAERRRQEREVIRQQKAEERAQKAQEKEERQRYLEERQAEAQQLTADAEDRVARLQSILEATLEVDDAIEFDSLRMAETPPSTPMPDYLVQGAPSPNREDFVNRVPRSLLVDSILLLGTRYRRRVARVLKDFDATVDKWRQSEEDRAKKIEEFKAKEKIAQDEYVAKATARNLQVDELQRAYDARSRDAVITYSQMVLERSEYPEGLPQQFRITYAVESKELVVDYDLPGLDVIPTVIMHTYVKSKDSIETKPRRPSEINDLYQDVVASIALRTIHEVLEADRAGHIDVVTFSGFVTTVDRATGHDIRPCLISVRVTRAPFLEINLARVDKRACLRNLGAQVSPRPSEMLPVKPVVEFDMVDKRFVEQGDVLDDLESRPNMMELTPTEFETLVSNLFAKMGLETKLTRASRDGGVDAVAFDTRPVLGGKVVIQAKRYKNTVGVSAVRDLYGTMMNEGASKGILVTTSSYGPDAYEFVKDKPLELIDGSNLLFLLEKVGVKARIVMPLE